MCSSHCPEPTQTDCRESRRRKEMLKKYFQPSSLRAEGHSSQIFLRCVFAKLALKHLNRPG